MLLLYVIVCVGTVCCSFFFFQAEDGIRDAQESRGLGDVYKRQANHIGPLVEKLKRAQIRLILRTSMEEAVAAIANFSTVGSLLCVVTSFPQLVARVPEGLPVVVFSREAQLDRSVKAQCERAGATVLEGSRDQMLDAAEQEILTLSLLWSTT
eukprot:TRINITY_DN58107_c0_g1_i1.p1 TRINITY_DN58107_c0_g1~~TRINITY_DN58107_c0_g1_i1.p1  ORF type:complete len:153 (-),score=46.17 TRINITY_DN58107_c0_g1_i1:46-504(-)